jgi:hypothetical protein
MTHQLSYSNFHIKQHISKQERGKEKGGPTLQNRQKTEKKGLNIFSEVLGNSSYLQISSTCRCSSIKGMELQIWWHSRNQQAWKRKNLISKKKTRQRKKIDKHFQGQTHVQESSTAALMVLTAWCNISTDFTSGGLSFSPQFCDMTWVVIIQKTT